MYQFPDIRGSFFFSHSYSENKQDTIINITRMNIHNVAQKRPLCGDDIKLRPKA